MTRELLLGKILKHLYDNGESYWQIDELANQYFGVKDTKMIESIVDEMIEKNWVTPKNHSKWSVIITFEGRRMLDEHGSYTSFLDSLGKLQKKVNREKNINRLISFIKFGGVLWGAVFTYLNHNKSELIKQKENVILQQKVKADSLNQVIAKQNLTIDSLRKFSTLSDLKNKNKTK